MKYNYKINEANYQKTVLDFVTHYHLGNEKIKRIKEIIQFEKCIKKTWNNARKSKIN